MANGVRTAVRFEVLNGSTPNTYKIVVTNTITKASLVYDPAGPWGRITNSMAGVRTRLERIQTNLGGTPSPSQLALALTELTDYGLQKFREFVGDDSVRRAATIAAFVREAESLMQAGTDDQTVMQIELEGPDEILVPLELFPLFDEQVVYPTSDIMEILNAARSLVGFRASIRRVASWREMPTDQRLRRNLKTSLGLFIHWELPGALSELNWFAADSRIMFDQARPDRAKTWGRLVAPWLVNTSSKERISEVATRIANPPATFFGAGDQVTQQLVHFSCHCDTSSEDTADHHLILGSGNTFKVSMQSLSRARSRSKSGDGALGFINACKGGDVRYGLPFSIPSQFLQVLGYRAIVAPIVDIDDRGAADMSSLFYAALLSTQTRSRDGMSVGSALLAARCELLKFRCTPIGLAYLCHGETDLYISDGA